MKRLVGVIMAAFMIFAVAGSAAAFTADGGLSVTFYNLDDNEVAFNITDDIGTIDFTATNLVVKNAIADYSVLSDMTLTENLTDVKVGLVSYTPNPAYRAVWTSTDSTVYDGAKFANVSDFGNSVTDMVNNKYNNQSPDKYVSPVGDLQFNQGFNSQGIVPGEYQGVNRSPDLEDAVGTLDANGKVELYIFETFFDQQGTDYTTCSLLGTVSVYDNGMVVVNEQAAVPVPGAIILLGSGLLGLVGIRRKK